MSDVLAIVSAAVFDKARDARGKPLRIGATYATDVYVSNNKTIAGKLSGDLYLVTVRDGALWLVAVLERPRHDGSAWRAAANVVPVVDITALASGLEFDTGSGVNLERMAMSLQTPRGLTAGDVARLRGAVAAAPSFAVDEAVIEALVVKLAAAVLGRTEAEVRADRGRYTTFHWDDGFVEEHYAQIDWSTLTLPVDEPCEHLFGRRDFDLRRSLFEAEEFSPDATTDRTLRTLLARQRGSLYGEQLATLSAQKRLSPRGLDCPRVLGRLRGGTSLIEAMRSLLMLDDFGAERLEPCEYAETHADWVDLLAAIEPPTLREHVSLFFQEEEAARCCGAYFEGADRAMFRDDEPRRYEGLVSWAIGEGQGSFCLVQIVDDTIAEVPEFAGHVLLRKSTAVPAGATPPVSGRSDEITAVPLRTHLERLDPDDGLRRMLLADDGDPAATAARLAAAERKLRGLLDEVRFCLEEQDYRTALAVLAACAAGVRPKLRWLVEYPRCLALARLRCFPEALASAELCLQSLRGVKDPDITEAHVHELLARAAYHLGELDRALKHADLAVALGPTLLAAHAIRGCVLFARGDVKAAFKALEKAMKAGVDPEPRPELAADPAYRDLALRWRIPVELGDDEAAALGLVG